MLNAWNKIKELINKKQNILNITTGTEYETGRIIDGKKEYAKRINCGKGPNNETIQVETGLTNVEYTKIEFSILSMTFILLLDLQYDHFYLTQ